MSVSVCDSPKIKRCLHTPFLNLCDLNYVTTLVVLRETANLIYKKQKKCT